MEALLEMQTLQIFSAYIPDGITSRFKLLVLCSRFSGGAKSADHGRA